MKVNVTDTCVVMVDQTSTVTYSRGDSITAPRAHIEDIERQGKGKRVGGDEPDDAAGAGANGAPTQ